MDANAVEERMEQLCLTFEAMKPYLVELWDNPLAPYPGETAITAKETAHAGND